MDVVRAWLVLLLVGCGPYVGNGRLVDDGQCAEEHRPVMTADGMVCFSEVLESCCQCLVDEACVSDAAACEESFLDNELPVLEVGRESCLEDDGECWEQCTGEA
ncbi:MAG: hypothetical protein AAFQ82_18890 [Myxococcota bacterium]